MSINSRFTVMYCLLAFIGGLSIVLGTMAWFSPRLPADLARQGDVQAVAAKAKAAAADVAGEQNLYALCEAQTTTAITGNGGSVTGYKTVSVKRKGETAKVVIFVKSNIYTGNVTCEFTHSNWTVTQLAPS